MKSSIKKTFCILLTICLIFPTVSCGSSSSQEKNNTLTIAYQYGMAYAPLQVVMEQELIEKYYPDVTVNWQVLNSGSAITEGLTSHNIDIGAMGVAPAVTAISKGVPCKIMSALSSQPHKLMCNDPSIKSLSDITSENKIALVNIGSIQHILLSMAAEKELGDAHALDNNILAMSHPDGMTALLSGSVSCQLTTSPYVFKEAENDNIHSISSISDVWPDGNTFIVALASTELHDNNPELFTAVANALSDAIDYLNNNPEEAASMLCQKEDVSKETMLSWLQDPACGYSTETIGVMQMADFMERVGFIDNVPKSFSELTFENVKGN